MKHGLVCIAFTLTALFCGRSAHAAVIMSLEQVGADVVATGTGTVDLTDLTFESSYTLSAEMVPSVAILLEGGGGEYDIYKGISGPSSFGSGSIVPASTGAGDALVFDGHVGEIAVPHGYVSGTPLSSTATWDSTTLAHLEVNQGIYVWTWGSGVHADSLTLYAGVPLPVSVPEPAPGLLLMGPAAAFVVFTRLKRRVNAISRLGIAPPYTSRLHFRRR